MNSRLPSGTPNKFYCRLAVSLLIGLAVSQTSAMAALSTDFDPEVASSVWQEANNECASVTLNGVELVAFQGHSTRGSASERADALAERLQALLSAGKIDPDKLMPAKDGDLAALTLNNVPVLKFEATEGESQTSAINTSFKVANIIRTQLGANPLPESMLNLLTKSKDGMLKSLSASFSGTASWYGPHFHGRKTASGNRFNMDGMTAAHRTLPLGTKLLVRNRKTGQSCVVKVDDRGPFVGNRVLDLSRGAARQLSMISSGTTVVDCFVLEQ